MLYSYWSVADNYIFDIKKDKQQKRKFVIEKNFSWCYNLVGGNIWKNILIGRYGRIFLFQYYF